ncbi:MAG TPA: NDP-sugar synthase [Solirubrobacterales bacterium]|nr:NDP-sugar synthase [Solirubrobacterales bacterium]
MQALVLVGGKGTRLRPLTYETPKPALTLVDRPFLNYMTEWLGSHGVDEVILACGFLPDELKKVLGEGEPGGPKLRYLVEEETLGTAGAIRFALDHLDERFFALNGDVLADLDLTALWNQHEETGAQATLGLYEVEDSSSYGLVDIDSDGQVLKFSEKDPTRTGAGLINAGTYVLEREAIAAIEPGREVSIETEFYPSITGKGLYARPLEGYWMDFGTRQRYFDASWDILEGRIHTEVEKHSDGVFIAAGAEVDPTATIGPRAVIGAGAKVASGARVTGSVVLEGSEIGADAVIENSIIGPGVNVAARGTVGNEVLGKNEIGETVNA